ncbi:amino acid adenylation domain-containing protein [Lentzea rhizosphaerae]|uniref:Amino acid adenylation domain-containing protein n=1 Tax=Lentzea rhizosphaerae TaxID=2041025 RepID=A0ABV8BLB9_9PSEU
MSDQFFEEGPRTAYPRDSTLPAQVLAQAALTPDAHAVHYDGRTLTYRELVGYAGRVSESLRAAGVRRGGVVAVLDRPSLRMIVVFLAILQAGSAYLPLDESNPHERNLFMVRDSGASLILAEDVEGFPEAVRLSEVDAMLNAPLGEEEPRDLAPGATAVDAAYVMYTSGSTGTPKGIAIPHRAITRLVVGTDYVDLGRDDVIAQASNASFDAATFEIWGALLNGGLLVGLPKEQLLISHELKGFLDEHRVTTLFLTAAVFHLHATESPDLLGGLRNLLVGGDVMDARISLALLEAGPPQRLLNAYGPTEATTFSTAHVVDRVSAASTALPIGRPLANTLVRILDGTRRVAPGEVGELHIGGDGLALGYVNRPSLTAERFVADPWCAGGRLYRTGDLARWTSDGQIEFLGRADGQTKLRGYRIELGEIEAVLRGHELVRDAVVIVEGEGEARRLIAYVAVRNPIGTTELRRHLVRVLPEHMVPARLIELPSLPLNANGKVDRVRISELH